MPRHQRQVSASQGRYAEELPVSLAAAPMYSTAVPRITIPDGYYGIPTTTTTTTTSGAGSMNMLSGVSQGPYNPFGQSSAPPVIPPAQHRPSSGAWSIQDDQQLLQARMQGLNWAQIKDTYFPNKTGNACRKRHERLMERKGADDFDNRKMERIAKEYMSMRKEIWQGLAARTGEKWSVVEQKCLSSGLKNLQSHARTASRRERERAGSASGAAYSGYDDDSGISGIGLTPVDELDASYSSPGTTASSSGGQSASSGSNAGGYAHAHPHYSHPGASIVSYPHTSHSSSQLQPPIQSMNGGYHISAPYNGGYAPTHDYSSSVSSSASAYGNGGGSRHSPYVSRGRGQSAEMGIGSLVNRSSGKRRGGDQ